MMAGALLAFTPLMDPLTAVYPGMSDYWLWLLVPLIVVISTVYKGTRVENLKSLPLGVLVMSFQILLFMTAAAVGVAGIYWVLIRVL